SAELPDSIPGAEASPLVISTWNDNSGIQFSPEQFVLLSLDPGNTIAWSRTYTFGAIPEPASITLILTAGLFLSSRSRRSMMKRLA
ncbi:MAG: PEP-CTERM sorting domain-containing protein, partial [Lacipirellulaceae bacterium]